MDRYYRKQSSNKEIFEWLGDAILEANITHCLLYYWNLVNLSFHSFCYLRSTIVSNTSLNKVYHSLGYFKNDNNNNIISHKNDKYKADFIESIIGEKICNIWKLLKENEILMQTSNNLKIMKNEKTIKELLKSIDSITCEIMRMEFDEWKLLPNISRNINFFNLLDSTSDNESEIVEESELLYKNESNIKYNNVIISSTILKYNYSLNLLKENINIDIFSKIICGLNELSNENHILYKSKNVYNIFKLYGLSVIKKHISLQMVLTNNKDNKLNDRDPGKFTIKRQNILSLDNLYRISKFIQVLWFIETREINRHTLFQLKTWYKKTETISVLWANDLRVFVGYLAISSLHHTECISLICTLIFYFSNKFNDKSLTDALSPSQYCNQVYDSEKDLNVEISKFISFYNLKWYIRNQNYIKSCFPLPKTMQMVKKSFQERSFLTDTLLPLLAPKYNENVNDKCYQLEDKIIFPTFNHIMELKVINKKRKYIDTNLSNKNKKRKEDIRRVENGKRIPRKNRSILQAYKNHKIVQNLEKIIVSFAKDGNDKFNSFFEKMKPTILLWIEKEDYCGLSQNVLTFSVKTAFHRLILHSLCAFHGLKSKTYNTEVETNVTILEVSIPYEYEWDIQSGTLFTCYNN